MNNSHAHTQTPNSVLAQPWVVQRVKYRQANYQSAVRDKRLLADSQLCLNAVLHDFGCNACQTHCPVEAIQFDSQGLPQVTGQCTDCGQCAVVCPTASFHQPSFTLPDLTDFEPSEPLQIVCQLEQGIEAVKNQWHVPCIGGIKASQLLKLAGSFPLIEVIDKGQCQGCLNAAGCEDKVDLVNHQAWWYLQELGLSERLQVKSLLDPNQSQVERSSPQTQASSNQPKENHTISRRGLFQNLLKRTEYTSVSQPKTNVIYHTQYRLMPLERKQQWHELKQLGDQHSMALNRFLPAIKIKADCCDHQVCRSSCPTGAIFGYERDGARGLVFDAAHCVACGLCQQVCPEQQLQFFETNGGSQPKAVTRHERRTCFECGHDFSRNQLDDTALLVCPTCNKDKQLFNSLWG